MYHIPFVLRQGFALSALVISLISCGLESSPWDTRIESSQTNLTHKHLQWLKSIDPGYQDYLKFAIIGDPQGTPEDFYDTIQTINQHDELAFILILGDMTDYGLKHEYEWAAKAIAASNKPVLTVIGNHDAIAHGTSIYKTMFGPLDYSFDFAGFQFVMWNNNVYEFKEPNFSWLSSQVTDRTIVASHVPPVVDMHTEAQVNYWIDMQADAGIVASLHGHRGGVRSFYWQQADIPYYVVARNRGLRWGKVEITDGKQVTISYCRQSCRQEAPL